MLHLMWQIHHSKAENTKQANQNSKYANQNSKYAKQNSKYAQYQFTLFYRDAIFVANLRTFLAYNLQAKKGGGVQKKQIWGMLLSKNDK